MCILIWHKRIWLVESRHATSYYYKVCFSLDKQNHPKHVITHLNVEGNSELNYVITGFSLSNIFLHRLSNTWLWSICYIKFQQQQKTPMHLSVCNSQYFYYISNYLSVYLYDIYVNISSIATTVNETHPVLVALIVISKRYVHICIYCQLEMGSWKIAYLYESDLICMVMKNCHVSFYPNFSWVMVNFRYFAAIWLLPA